MILVLSLPVMSDEIGIHGELSLKQSQFSLIDDSSNICNKSNQLWKLDIYYNFDYFNIGFNLITNTDGYTIEYGIPSFEPTSQFYEWYIVIEPIQNIFIKGSQWCNHPTLNNRGLNKSLWKGGYSIELSYKF